MMQRAVAPPKLQVLGFLICNPDHLLARITNNRGHAFPDDCEPFGVFRRGKRLFRFIAMDSFVDVAVCLVTDILDMVLLI